MFKNLIAAAVGAVMSLFAVEANAQAVYNSIATAYVTTTISQQVVFNSAMQAGGTYTLSVLAHNGGGRAGQSDTAHRLHHSIKTPARGPRPGVTERAQRYRDYAGAQLRQRLGRKSAATQRARAVAL